MKLRAIDVSFGRVKGITEEKRIKFPSLLGDFRPVRFSTGIEKKAALDNLCIEYSGKKYFVGEMTRRQSQPRVTMGLSGLRMLKVWG